MKVIAQNKKSTREFHVLEKFEAGIVLVGTEVKSIRAGKVQLGDAFVQIQDETPWLVRAHIAEYAQGTWTNHMVTRKRKLLLHKREIRRLRGKVDEKGLTLIPLKMYLNDRGLVKVEIALGRGKRSHDKREDIKKRDAARDIQRAMRRGN